MLSFLFKRWGDAKAPIIQEERAPLTDFGSPFGYKPSTTPATRESRYSAAVIDAHVRSHIILAKDDHLVHAHAEELYEIYADYLAHLPPYRQVLALEGNRPLRYPEKYDGGNKRFITLGESNTMQRSKENGIYTYHNDQVDVRVQELRTDPQTQEMIPVLKSKSEIQGTISHETAHQEDRQLMSMSGYGDEWSRTSENWSIAIQKEIDSGNVGAQLQAILPDTRIKLSTPHYIQPKEAKAEFEKLFCLVYTQKDGDFKAASDVMVAVYPHMWPVFESEYLAKAMKVAAELNPHINLYAKSVGFDNRAFPVLQKNIVIENNPVPHP